MKMLLTEAQSRAVNVDHPAILCVAGPGSGKTTVLSLRINQLMLNSADPASMAAITFTNAAARHLEEKIGFPLGFCGTLHGYCLRMLKLYGSALGYGERTAILDEEASLDLLTSKAKALGCKTPMDKLVKLKAEGMKASTLSGMTSRRSVDDLVIASYYEELRESGLVDFDSILTEFLRFLITHHEILDWPFTHLFVDEVQDSAAIDWRIYRALPMANKFMVGDPDQSLYAFRGGRPDLMTAYGAEKGVLTLLLEANFRCPTQVCTAANSLIKHNVGRIAKLTIPSDEKPGKVIRFGETLNEGDEIAQVQGYIKILLNNGDEPQDIAIISRTNAIATGFRQALKAAGVPVVEPPTSDLPKDWPRARALVELLAQPENDTLAYFYLIQREQAFSASTTPAQAQKKAHDVRRECNFTGQSINKVFLKFHPQDVWLSASVVCDAERISRESMMLMREKRKNLPIKASLLDLALEMGRNEPSGEAPAPGVTCTTYHGAKGKEWDHVFLVGMEDEIIPGKRETAELEEERRCLFVGITRAKKCLYLSHAASRKASWGNQPIISHTPSRFLKEAGL